MRILSIVAAFQRWLECRESSATDANAGSSCLAGNASETSTFVAPSVPNLNRLLGLFIVLGLLARAIRYYLCFPLWDDESFLCVNFINRSYAELLQPLDYHQVAPLLFLWIERTAVKIFGFSENALRLYPFVCSIASLFLFRRVAGQLLSGIGLVFAVAIFAVSYPGIRYAAEAKPYCTDMFISLVILAIVVEWYRLRDSRLLVALAVLMPFALGASYSAVFAAGGLSLVVGAVLLSRLGTRREWLAWFAWNISLVASFAIWFVMVGRVQSGAEAEFMGKYWEENFPPIKSPLLLPYWMLKTHASDFLAYPIGGPHWASVATLFLCLGGLWRLGWQRQFLWLGLLLGPASLHFLAAALQKYPYGGHVKFSQYLAPMICCLASVGIVQFLDWLPRVRLSGPRGIVSACIILIAVGCGSIVRDLAIPYKTHSDERARAFARAFWVGTHYAEEVTCLKSDLGIDFVPDQHRDLSWSAQFRCNRAIEVSRSSLRTADFTRVTSKRPLRCVFYRDSRFEVDEAEVKKWLDEMQKKYLLVARESIPFPRFAKNERLLLAMEFVDSYKFIPLAESPDELRRLADERDFR